MAVTRTETYADITDLLDELENRTIALKAFGVILECAMRDNVNFPVEKVSEGTYILLDQQFKTLDFLGGALRDQYNDLKGSPFQIMPLDRIAEVCGVSRQKVSLILSAATGLPILHFDRKGEPA